mmetsp:Transcript_6691/g.14983  ORF Transcript_6691/g.14983 Transcript_6691/m.14983 type:complete len:372 (-) Transcript_6691:1197-2312(-)
MSLACSVDLIFDPRVLRRCYLVQRDIARAQQIVAGVILVEDADRDRRLTGEPCLVDCHHLQRKIERLVPDRIQRAVDDLGRLLIAIPLNDHKRIRRTVRVSRNQFVGAEKTDSQVSNAWFTLDDITNLHVLGHMPIEQDLTRESTCRDRACWLLSSNFLLVGIWLIKRQLDLDLAVFEQTIQRHISLSNQIIRGHEIPIENADAQNFILELRPGAKVCQRLSRLLPSGVEVVRNHVCSHCPTEVSAMPKQLASRIGRRVDGKDDVGIRSGLLKTVSIELFLGFLLVRFRLSLRLLDITLILDLEELLFLLRVRRRFFRLILSFRQLGLLDWAHLLPRLLNGRHSRHRLSRGGSRRRNTSTHAEPSASWILS